MADETVEALFYDVLIEFSFRHMDFQLAELQSVLDMNGILLTKKLESPNDCMLLPLPNVKYTENRPFTILRFHRDLVSSKDIGYILLSRCVLVRSVVELWGAKSSDISACAKEALAFKNTSKGEGLYRLWNESTKWKFTVQTLGSKYTVKEQNEMRAHFSVLEFPGVVDIENADEEFIYIQENELDEHGGSKHPRHFRHPELEAKPPLAHYFGRALGRGRNVKRMGGQIAQYDLKFRKYLGPTSMDSDLGFIMTNLGQVTISSSVLDPFVGTGSILLSCAIRGAYCTGTDIDIRVLRGKSKHESIWANFQQFNLPRPDLIRSDNGIYNRHFRTTTGIYDAIICDPPYGIRAGARQSGSKKDVVEQILPQFRHDHIAKTKPYPVADVMADLLDVAAQTLKIGGRLVYIIPSLCTNFDEDSDLPRHPCLERVHSCYQPFSEELGRRMVTMKKTTSYDPELRDQYMQQVWKNGPESANKCADIRDKIIEATKKKPGYAERAAIRKRKRQLHKLAKKEAKRRTHEQIAGQSDKL